MNTAMSVLESWIGLRPNSDILEGGGRGSSSTVDNSALNEDNQWISSAVYKWISFPFKGRGKRNGLESDHGTVRPGPWKSRKWGTDCLGDLAVKS